MWLFCLSFHLLEVWPRESCTCRDSSGSRRTPSLPLSALWDRQHRKTWPASGRRNPEITMTKVSVRKPRQEFEFWTLKSQCPKVVLPPFRRSINAVLGYRAGILLTFLLPLNRGSMYDYTTGFPQIALPLFWDRWGWNLLWSYSWTDSSTRPSWTVSVAWKTKM